ncbi:MAG: hypothetical protein KA586_07420 [Candidatus Promineofilum sp.]|nr:hypothetical protein [Promineifilum sp.]
MIDKCPECGAPPTAGQACRDYFHQMLFWESEDRTRWAVHHLMVLCYHLQHPSLYSAEGLVNARGLLTDFIERGLSPQEVRRKNSGQVASGARDWTITARPGNQGAYDRPIRWTMTAADVVAAGAEAYVESVGAWARAVHADIRQSIDK